MTRLKRLSLAAALAAFSLAGAVVAEEAPAARGLAAIETDGDGEISRAEIAALNARRFQRLDLNGDGAVTLDEMNAATDRIFDAIDTNRDGKISRAELRGKLGELRSAIGLGAKN
ncbi:EF-hand domain-containing protein [Paenirhodobacter enshiensis]|uniref:EF-hand domain-containing protein n=1 Tax=Paenirhodobacter enshiensis TaxID=1105367 RepID=UPI0035B3A25D